MDEILSNTTEMVATPTDSSSMTDSFYSASDMYLLLYAFIIFLIAVRSKVLFRKMYINLLGGRKGE